MAEFTDSTTPLNQAHFNALALDGSHIESGTLPTSSGSLSIAFPAMVYVINTGSAALEVPATAQSYAITTGASTLAYVFVNTSGAYSQSISATVPANSMLVCSANVNSGNSALTTITQLAIPYAMTGEQIAAVSETPETTALGVNSTVGDNIRRLWGELAATVGALSGQLTMTGAAMFGITVQDVHGVTFAVTRQGAVASAGHFTAIPGSNAASPLNIVLTVGSSFTTTNPPMALLFYSIAGGASGIALPASPAIGPGNWDQWSFSVPQTVSSGVSVYFAYLILAVAP